MEKAPNDERNVLLCFLVTILAFHIVTATGSRRETASLTRYMKKLLYNALIDLLSLATGRHSLSSL